MRGMGRGKAHVARSDCRDLVLDTIEAAAGGDDVDLVALVRRLRSVGRPRPMPRMASKTSRTISPSGSSSTVR
jgi:hypothetical protein